MRYLFLSDIHSNLEAFERIIQELPSLNIDQLVYLGDLLGYGASPQECIDLARKHPGIFILGNHEYEMLRHCDTGRLNSFAAGAIAYTLDNISDDDVAYLKKFELIEAFGDCTCVHGSPQEPEVFDYLLESSDASRVFRYLKTKLCFVGHTHLPTLFIEGDSNSYHINPGKFQLDTNKRYIINGGSVGQPRDKDKRLSCIIFDDAEYSIELIRLDYDKHKAADKIIRAGLPESLAHRLI